MVKYIISDPISKFSCLTTQFLLPEHYVVQVFYVM